MLVSYFLFYWEKATCRKNILANLYVIKMS